jgi:hypothetical protein
MPIGTSSGHRRLAARAAMAQIGAVGAALSPMSTTGTHVTGRDAKIMARLSAPKTSDHANIIQLKVTLRRVKPPVWRRLLMPGTMNLGELHTAIQAAMGWDDCHLHVFDIGGESFGDRRSVDDVADEKRPTLNGLLRSSVIRFSYTYDFGDNWEHTIAFEKSELAVEGGSYPACIGGKRNCPPEDCGGPWGYQRLLAILADPDHPEHADQIDWIGEEFEPNEFNVEHANTVLAATFAKK